MLREYMYKKFGRDEGPKKILVDMNIAEIADEVEKKEGGKLAAWAIHWWNSTGYTIKTEALSWGYSGVDEPSETEE